MAVKFSVSVKDGVLTIVDAVGEATVSGSGKSMTLWTMGRPVDVVIDGVKYKLSGTLFREASAEDLLAEAGAGRVSYAQLVEWAAETDTRRGRVTPTNPAAVEALALWNQSAAETGEDPANVEADAAELGPDNGDSIAGLEAKLAALRAAATPARPIAPPAVPGTRATVPGIPPANPKRPPGPVPAKGRK